MDWGVVIGLIVAIAGAVVLSGGDTFSGVIIFFIIYIPLGGILSHIHLKKKRERYKNIGSSGSGYSGGGSVGQKIYYGSYGYDVAYRIDGNKIYSGSYGYDVAYRIDGDRIYSGSYGYDVAFRIDGEKVYSGSYGYDVAFRIDGKNIYLGSYGYDVAYRLDF